MLKLIWREHDAGGNKKRIWFSDWQGDQFQVIDNESFFFIENICNRFNIPIEEASEE
jgi:hypothetical protein